MTSFVQHVSARKIERQAKAESDTFMHFGDSALDAGGGQEVQVSVIGVMEPPVIVNIEPVMIEFMEPFCDRNYRASW